MEKIYLSPGELVVAREPVMVTTVLGSCISVTMFHPRSGTAAICHAMLPSSGKNNSFRYVDASIDHMANYFKRLKIRPEDMEVKLFGGADMFPGSLMGERIFSVGWQNILAARECLELYGLAPVASDVGGGQGRKLIFKTDSGVVFVRKKGRSDSELLR